MRRHPVAREAGLCFQVEGGFASSYLVAGFPAFRGGVLRHADAVGIPVVVDRLRRLADAHGERFRPADSLQSMVRRQSRFYG